jgi:hypothetical protein
VSEPPPAGTAPVPLDVVVPDTVTEAVRPAHPGAMRVTVVLTMLPPERLTPRAMPSVSHRATSAAPDPMVCECSWDPAARATALPMAVALSAMQTMRDVQRTRLYPETTRWTPVREAAGMFEAEKSTAKLVPDPGAVPETSPSEAFDAPVRVILYALEAQLVAEAVSSPLTVTVPMR